MSIKKTFVWHGSLSALLLFVLFNGSLYAGAVPNGHPCDSDNDCQSSACYPFPPYGNNLCVAKALNCAYPNTAGRKYTDPPIDINQSVYKCKNPGDGGRATWLPRGKANGLQCNANSDCQSRYCWFYPDGENYCMAERYRCAFAKTAGAAWGERTTIGGETYQCNAVGNMNWVNVQCPSMEVRRLNMCRDTAHLNNPNFCPVSYPVSTGVGSARDCSGRGPDCQALREAEKIVGKPVQIKLEQSASIARNTAHPIPQNILQLLQCFFEPVVFEGMKYTSNYNPDGRLITLLSTLAGGASSGVIGGILGAAAAPAGWQDIALYASASAITLGQDIIAFRHQGDADGNPILWAHELEHTRQYRQLGNEGFADMYAYRAGTIEFDAERKELYVCDQLAMRQPPIQMTDCRSNTCKIEDITPTYCSILRETYKPHLHK